MAVYTYAQIAEHNTAEDLWIIVAGKVYDCTKFVDEHPGGEEVIIELAGQDATSAFEDIGHSGDAYKMLEPLYVGDLDKTSEPVVLKSATKSTETTGGEGNGLMILAILAVFAAVAYYFYTQQ